MTGTPPATRPPVCSPFLRETLRRLSGERLVIFQASKFEQILIVDQYLHNLVQSCVPLSFLLSIVDLFSLQLLLNSSTQLPLRLQQCHTFRLASPPLVR